MPADPSQKRKKLFTQGLLEPHHYTMIYLPTISIYTIHHYNVAAHSLYKALLHALYSRPHKVEEYKAVYSLAEGSLSYVCEQLRVFLGFL